MNYEYDAYGRRVKESAGGQERQYLIDRLLPYGQVIAESDVGNDLLAGYVYGLERISQERGGVAHWYLANGQGSVRQLSDSNGFVSDTYEYSAFGEALASTGIAPNDFRYVGEEADPNSGFYYLRARWMNPRSGRVPSVDPFDGDSRTPNTLHRYLYTNNSPISYIDPGWRQYTLTNVLATITVVNILTSIVWWGTVGSGAGEIEWTGQIAEATIGRGVFEGGAIFVDARAEFKGQTLRVKYGGFILDLAGRLRNYQK